MIEIRDRFRRTVYKDPAADCIRAAVSYAMKNRISLENAVIEHANLNSLLLYVDLIKNVTFDHCSFCNVTFDHCSFCNASFLGTINKIRALNNTTFIVCDLTHASFGGNHLKGVSFKECNLANTSFYRSIIRNTKFSDCNLAETGFNDADLTKEQIKKLQRKNPLSILFDQPGKLYAYKFVDKNYRTVYQRFQYNIGKSYDFTEETNPDPLVTCGAGLNVATMDWCIRYYNDKDRILKVEFTAKDIACIPLGSDGKFRLYRGKIVGEVKNIKKKYGGK